MQLEFKDCRDPNTIDPKLTPLKVTLLPGKRFQKGVESQIYNGNEATELT